MDLKENTVGISELKINNEIKKIKRKVEEVNTPEVLKKLFTLVDLTSLNTADTTEKIKTMAQKVSNFKKNFNDFDNVAAICVYPSLISTIKENLKDKEVKIASVGACFPSSQSFLSVKAAECDLCIKKGADEIDIVISVGMFLEENYQQMATEISLIKSTIKNKQLKVILETGELKNLQNIYNASILSIESGADFIKTSTGKTPISATPEAVYTMCIAIKDHFDKTGKMVGIKPSGGMSVTKDALLYYSIVKEILGENWLTNKYFRLGTSRLANKIIQDYYKLSGIDKGEINYF